MTNLSKQQRDEWREDAALPTFEDSELCFAANQRLLRALHTIDEDREAIELFLRYAYAGDEEATDRTEAALRARLDGDG